MNRRKRVPDRRWDLRPSELPPCRLGRICHPGPGCRPGCRAIVTIQQAIRRIWPR